MTNLKLITIVLFLISQQLLRAQDSSYDKYYKDDKLQKETIKKKANYKLSSVASGKDSIVELINLKTNQVISHEEFTYKRLNGKCFYWNNETLETDTVQYRMLSPDGYYHYDYKNQKLKFTVGDFINPMFIVEGEEYSKDKKYELSFITIWTGFSLRYPIEAIEQGIKGKVYVQFTLDEEGNVGNVGIIKGVHKLLDKEAYRVIKSLPRMYPARLNGEPVPLFIEKPIDFNLL